MDTDAAHRTFVSGPELKNEREAAELTQAAVAEAMGVLRTLVTANEARARVKPGFVRRYREAIAALTGKAA